MRNKYHILSLLIGLLFIGLCPIHAQNIELEVRVDTNNITIGDQIEASFIAKHGKDIEVLWPIWADTLGAFELIGGTMDKTESGDQITEAQRLTLTIFDSGFFEVPSVKIPYKNISSSLIDTLTTNPRYINVDNPSVNLEEEIKPIKEPLDAPFSWQEILFFILLVLATIAIIIYVIRTLFYKDKHDFSAYKPAKPRPPAAVEALERLRTLEQEKRWQKGEVKPYYSDLTDILRNYINRRYEIPALEETTDEILASLVFTDLPKTERLKLQSLLEQADLVKFAKYKPSVSENMDSIAHAKEFVLNTKRVASPQKESPTSETPPTT